MVFKMAAWSSVLRAAGQNIAKFYVTVPKQVLQNGQSRYMSSHRTMPIQASRWQWHKTKDLLHFYTMLGMIPVLTGVFIIYVFIGPATLTPIPEGYTPKHWEYHRNPVTRWMMRYLYPPPQQGYEKYMHYVAEETEKAQMRGLEAKIKQLMKERRDYQAYYYRPYITKYHYVVKEEEEKLPTISGD